MDEKNRQALLKVIDLKVEDDMEKLLMKIQSEFGGIKTELSKMDNKFELLDGKFAHVDGKISTVFWVIGISTAITSLLIAGMGIFLAIIAFKQ